jgi:hypothetical protein
MRILGVAAVIIGAIILAFGFNASQAPVDQVSNALTGRYTDNTMWYLIGGAALLVAGALVALIGRRA